MSDAVRAAILGIIEGLTEFLPVSSTGHMILAMPWLGIDGDRDPWPAFLYFIQIGAILAVILYFFRRLWRQIFYSTDRRVSQNIMTKVIIGTVPAVIVGLTLDKFMEAHFEKPYPVALALITGGVIMAIVESRFRRTTGPTIEQVSLRQAFLIGIAQCFSIIPGTSRSMATIMGGLIVGLPAATSAEFSFYLAIPTICGAGLLRIIKHRDALRGENTAIMSIGFATSFIVAWLTVALFMRYIQTRSLKPFAIYRVILGAAVIAWWLNR